MFISTLVSTSSSKAAFTSCQLDVLSCISDIQGCPITPDNKASLSHVQFPTNFSIIGRQLKFGAYDCNKLIIFHVTGQKPEHIQCKYIQCNNTRLKLVLFLLWQLLLVSFDRKTRPCKFSFLNSSRFNISIKITHVEDFYHGEPNFSYFNSVAIIEE